MAARTISARTRVFRCLCDAAAPRTKQQLADELGLSMPTIYQALGSLADDGLVREDSELSSTGGRRATTFCVNERGCAAVGVSATGTLLRTVVCGLTGTELHTHEGPLDAQGDLGSLSAGIARGEKTALTWAHAAGLRVVGTGVAIPAVIEPGGSQVANARELGLDPFEGQGLLDGLTRLELPPRLLNDASCGGLAELAGVRAGSGTAAFLSLENGVGGAVLIDGRPFAGANGRSGEFGHICVEPGGRACSCGRHGCLQAYCSARRLTEAGGGGVGAFFSTLEAGAPEAAATWDDFADHLARGIVALRVALDCDVVLGGMLSPWIEPRLADVRARTLALLPFDEDADFVRIARHPRFGVPLGAAQAVIAEFVAGV